MFKKGLELFLLYFRQSFLFVILGMNLSASIKSGMIFFKCFAFKITNNETIIHNFCFDMKVYISCNRLLYQISCLVVT